MSFAVGDKVAAITTAGHDEEFIVGEVVTSPKSLGGLRDPRLCRRGPDLRPRAARPLGRGARLAPVPARL